MVVSQNFRKFQRNQKGRRRGDYPRGRISRAGESFPRPAWIDFGGRGGTKESLNNKRGCSSASRRSQEGKKRVAKEKKPRVCKEAQDRQHPIGGPKISQIIMRSRKSLFLWKKPHQGPAVGNTILSTAKISS